MSEGRVRVTVDYNGEQDAESGDCAMAFVDKGGCISTSQAGNINAIDVLLALCRHAKTYTTLSAADIAQSFLTVIELWAETRKQEASGDDGA